MVKSVEISSSIWRRRNGEKEEGGVVRKFSFEKNLLGWQIVTFFLLGCCDVVVILVQILKIWVVAVVGTKVEGEESGLWRVIQLVQEEEEKEEEEQEEKEEEKGRRRRRMGGEVF